MGKWQSFFRKEDGAGPGMVMQAEPILRAVQKAVGKKTAKVFIMSPRGKEFTQVMAQKLAKVFKTDYRVFL